MQEAIDPKSTDKTPVRCEECDREMGHYNHLPKSDQRTPNVCWECLGPSRERFLCSPQFPPAARGTVIFRDDVFLPAKHAKGRERILPANSAN
jgi:hypothetical protein